MTSASERYKEQANALGRHVDTCGECARVCKHADGALCGTGLDMCSELSHLAAEVLTANTQGGAS